MSFSPDRTDLLPLLSDAKTDHEMTALRRQIDATDKKIDRLVYEPYGLTEKEIRIKEGKDETKAEDQPVGEDLGDLL